MRTLIIIIALCSPMLAASAEVTLAWQDRSTNENGFEMRGRLPDGTWEVVATTATDVTEAVVDSETHDAWQVFAFNDWGYSTGGTNVLSKDLPEGPLDLRIKSKTETTESVTKTKTTTVTEYKT